MSGAVSAVNITSAALITQFFLAIIAFIAIFILRSGEPNGSAFRDEPDSSFLYFVTLGFALASIGCLIFSDEYAITWRPLFQDVPFRGIGWTLALKLVFILDIVWVTIVVAGTGGSSNSPFAPIYFMIPVFAIFLREPIRWLVIYLILITLTFSLNLASIPRGLDRGGNRRPHAYWFVSIASLVLATFIGFVTRPR